MILLVVALLAALSGVVVTVLAVISLQDPFTITGEIGARVEIRGELIAVTVIGGLMIVGGAGAAAGLVRAQLRAAEH